MRKGFIDVLKDTMPIITALVAFIGGMVTGEFRSAADVRLQNQKYLLDFRKTLCTDFFEGQAKLKQADQLETVGSNEEASKLRRDYELSTKTARFQIAVFSTKSVVDATVRYFGKYFQSKTCFGDSHKWKDDIRIYRAMRQEVFGNDEHERVEDNDLLLLVHDCRLAGEPVR